MIIVVTLDHGTHDLSFCPQAARAALLAAAAADRGKRASTKSKSETAEQLRLAENTRAMSSTKRQIKKEVVRHTQDELLAQAIETEVSSANINTMRDT